MEPRENLLRVYRELADHYEKQRQPQMRDRFLVLAADAALTAGRADEAERLRLRLLKVNPHHMIKPYASFAEALKAPDVLTYVKDLRVNYPAEVAEDLLRTLQGEEKRPSAGVPGTAPVLDIDGTLTSALPSADEGSTYFQSQEQDEDLAHTAAPGPLNAPRAGRNRRRKRSRCKANLRRARADATGARRALVLCRRRRRPAPPPHALHPERNLPTSRPPAPGSPLFCSCWFWRPPPR